MGTRPEVIKMAPVILLLKINRLFQCSVCVTSQHKELLEQQMNVFGLKADFDLDIMTHNQDNFDVSTKILQRLKPVIQKTAPDLILVQGDTNTAFIAALAGFYTKIRIAHIEAGLRTYRKDEPYPEEISRQMISRLAVLHFAPTEAAKQNLLNENIESSDIYVTGNTVIDALKYVQNLGSDSSKIKNHIKFLNIHEKIISLLYKPHKTLILVTMHREENIIEGIANVCKAIERLSQERDVVFVFSVHPNPNVKALVNGMLQNNNNIILTSPLPYIIFIQILNRCSFIITDSGGIQEEAAMLGKPVLVARNHSDRPESITAGIASLVGTEVEDIYKAALELIDNKTKRERMTRSMALYGDGHASEKIVEILMQLAKNGFE